MALPTSFVSFSPDPQREKAKRQHIPSSANDDTDTRAAQIKIKRKGGREGSFSKVTKRIAFLQLGLSFVWADGAK